MDSPPQICRPPDRSNHRAACRRHDRQPLPRNRHLKSEEHRIAYPPPKIFAPTIGGFAPPCKATLYALVSNQSRVKTDFTEEFHRRFTGIVSADALALERFGIGDSGRRHLSNRRQSFQIRNFFRAERATTNCHTHLRLNSPCRNIARNHELYRRRLSPLYPTNPPPSTDRNPLLTRKLDSFSVFTPPTYPFLHITKKLRLSPA